MWPVTVGHCWRHLRRGFVKQARNTKAPIAEDAVRQIAALDAVETTGRGSAPEARLAARKEYSAPIIAALKPWLEKQLSMISSGRSEEHTSELQSLMRISYAVFCLKKKTQTN